MNISLGDLLTFRVTKENVKMFEKEPLKNNLLRQDRSEHPIVWYQCLWSETFNNGVRHEMSERYRDISGMKVSCQYKNVIRKFKFTYDFALDEMKVDMIKE